jgi:GTPase
MGLKPRVERLLKAADPVVVTLRCMGRRKFTRSQLLDFLFGTPLDDAHPLRRMLAEAHSEAVFRGVSDAELEVYAQDDGPALPFQEDMEEAGEQAVRELDAAIARSEYPRLAEEITAWHRAREDRR